jgi:hypothetical protein
MKMPGARISLLGVHWMILRVDSFSVFGGVVIGWVGRGYGVAVRYEGFYIAV